MNTTHRINSDLDSAAQSIANHLASCAVLANSITQRVLALTDDEIVAWLNAQGDPTPLFTAHGQLGEAINAAATVAQTTLAQWGLTKDITTVDLRSVTEKLAAQHRAIELTESGWIVKPLPKPEPEPEQPITDQ